MQFRAQRSGLQLLHSIWPEVAVEGQDLVSALTYRKLGISRELRVIDKVLEKMLLHVFRSARTSVTYNSDNVCIS